MICGSGPFAASVVVVVEEREMKIVGENAILLDFASHTTTNVKTNL